MYKKENLNTSLGDLRKLPSSEEVDDKFFMKNKLSLLEKHAIETKNLVDSSRISDIEHVNPFDYPPNAERMSHMQQSLFEKNIYELYENTISKDEKHHNKLSLLEKQMMNIQSSDFKKKNEEFNLLQSRRKSSVINNIDKGNLLNAADPRIFSSVKVEPAMTNTSPIDTVPKFPEEAFFSVLNKKISSMETELARSPSSHKENQFKRETEDKKEAKEDIKTLPTEKKLLASKSNKYMLIKTIGRGNFAKVKLAKHMTTDTFVAIKIIDKTKMNSKILSKICREVTLMKELHHPNIVKLLEVMENESTLYLVLEYASGGELFDYLVVHGCMKEKEARVKFRQMVSAVHYCHRKLIVHRDLKAENMLLNSKMEIKIADFGFANIFDPNSSLDTFCGSPPYAAPELFMGHKYIGPEVDIWSLGVILFTMVSGRLPFDGSTLKELKDKVLNLRIEFPYFISTDCEHLLRKMLTISVKDRASLDNIMNDTWINGGGLPKLLPYREPTKVVIDHKRIDKLKLMGYDRDDIINSITENKYNAVYATYYLINKSGSDANKKLEEKYKKPQIVYPDIDPRFAAKPGNDETDSNSDKDRLSKDNTYHSLTGVSAALLAKSFKKMFAKKSDNTETQTPETTMDSTSASALNKDLQKQIQMVMLMDPNNSLPKGANQEALLATLNQMIWSKSGKAAMFQNQTLSTPISPRKSLIKNQIQTGPNFNQPGNGLSKTSGESETYPRFTVQMVKQEHPTTSTKLDKLENEMLENDENSPFNKIGNLLSVLNQPFRRKSKIGSDEKPNILEIEKVLKTLLPLQILIKPKPEKPIDLFSQDKKPRVKRFAFSLHTISSKDPDTIMKDVIQVLKEHGYFYENVEKYLLLCWNINIEKDHFIDSVEWEMEICRFPWINKHGVKIKRIFGSRFAYREVKDKIMKSLML